MAASHRFLSPRIWRCGDLSFVGDEVLQSPAVHTDAFFARVAQHGFDGVWIRGRLAELAESTILPQLNDAHRLQRLEALRKVMSRGHRYGVGTWLFFNEPLAPDSGHLVFDNHPEVRGRSHYDSLDERHVTAMCTSAPKVIDYLREAIAAMLDALPDLAGVILITASEYPTHCWSKYTTRLVDEADADPDGMNCARCASRAPADVVAELIRIWADAAAAREPALPVIAWNWSWSMWYDDPQREVIEQLPPSVGLMADFERGDMRSWRDREIEVDEYSLGHIGPSARFLKTKAVADRRNLALHAKLQLGTTHEIATVPNIPVIGNLHAKFVALHAHGVVGTMASWNFGLHLTLNTAAIHLFGSDPERYVDREAFFKELASQYLGVTDVQPLQTAWNVFAEAMTLYPFSIPMLYFGPVNYAPAYPFDLIYQGRELGPSWIFHEPSGDNCSNCLGPFTLDEVAAAFAEMAAIWCAVSPAYVRALANGNCRAHCDEESRVATMIGLQLQSTANVFAWNRWRGPGRASLDDVALAILDNETRVLEAAIPLVEQDPRLGFHQECQHRWYHPQNLRSKLSSLRQTLQR